MSQVVIRRCPVCPTIRTRTRESIEAVRRDLGVAAGIADGAKGEFTVLVDGLPVLQRNGDTLPVTEEVVWAVRNAVPGPAGG